MKNPLSLALLVPLVLALGCASARQEVPLPDQKVEVTSPDVTRIYFVRDDESKQLLNKQEILVFDGDTEVGALTKGTFLCWERPGGRTLGRAFYESVDRTQGNVEGIADLDCPAGAAHYFAVSVAREGGKPTVTRLDPAQGRKLVAERSPAGR